MIIENKEMGIRFEVDNQQDFDKWYAIRKEQIRTSVIEDVQRISKDMYLEITDTVNGNSYTSKNDLVSIVASKCRQYLNKRLEQLKGVSR